METESLALLRELKDRQEIYDCLMRYCRGIDRLDREILLSAYHPDAIDDHGSYVGPVEGFADYAMGLHAEHQHRTQHCITNFICEITGDEAHVESYYLFRSLNKTAPLYTMATGRYLDRMEKRDGKWGILDRICLVEVRNEFWAPTGTEGEADYLPSLRNRDDPSYMRPQKSDLSRLTQR